MDYSIKIKNRIKENAKKLLCKYSQLSGTEYETAFIYNNLSMNFNGISYNNILENRNWKKRLKKTHTQIKNVKEMQSSNSSDAILMNIFCHPDINKWNGIKKIIGLENINDISFGWNPSFSNENKSYPTEIDMKINNIIFEAKLTENDFKEKISNVVEGYENFNNVFDSDNMHKHNGNYLHYQLIRNILTAGKYNFRFILLIDECRIDLIKYLFDTIVFVRNINLRNNIKFVTWQELIYACGKELKEYMIEKYL
jgi:hypothetical protein